MEDQVLELDGSSWRSWKWLVGCVNWKKMSICNKRWYLEVLDYLKRVRNLPQFAQEDLGKDLEDDEFLRESWKKSLEGVCVVLGWSRFYRED